MLSDIGPDVFGKNDGRTVRPDGRGYHLPDVSREMEMEYIGAFNTKQPSDLQRLTGVYVSTDSRQFSPNATTVHFHPNLAVGVAERQYLVATFLKSGRQDRDVHFGTAPGQ